MMIPIEIVYVDKNKEIILTLSVEEKSTVKEALHLSKIWSDHPEILLEGLEGRVGIFGKVVDLNTSLQAGDRIEIYRYLMLDPKEARRLRSKKGTLSILKWGCMGI